MSARKDNSILDVVARPVYVSIVSDTVQDALFLFSGMKDTNSKQYYKGRCVLLALLWLLYVRIRDFTRVIVLTIPDKLKQL